MLARRLKRVSIREMVGLAVGARIFRVRRKVISPIRVMIGFIATVEFCFRMIFSILVRFILKIVVVV